LKVLAVPNAKNRVLARIREDRDDLIVRCAGIRSWPGLLVDGGSAGNDEATPAIALDVEEDRDRGENGQKGRGEGKKPEPVH
jgi:hypothetical protein